MATHISSEEAGQLIRASWQQNQSLEKQQREDDWNKLSLSEKLEYVQARCTYPSQECDGGDSPAKRLSGRFYQDGDDYENSSRWSGRIWACYRCAYKHGDDVDESFYTDSRADDFGRDHEWKGWEA